MKGTIIRWTLLAGAALALAWAASRAAMGVFGDTSPFRAEHGLIGMAFVLVWLWASRRRRGPASSVLLFLAALLPAYFGTALPDLDIALLGIGGHRNPLFHSALAYAVLWAVLRPAGAPARAALTGFGLGLASHLLWDLLDYGDVRWLPGGTADRLWLAGNGLACLLPPRRPRRGLESG